MAKTPIGYLRRPPGRDHVAAHAINHIVTAAATCLGDRAATDLLHHAGLFRMPDPAATVPQAQAALLHHALRDASPGLAPAIARAAGVQSADALILTQLSARAQTMLSATPWTVSAWLLGRWARQHAWTFAGSGTFEMVREMEFVIRGNPFAAGAGRTEAPVCLWQQALFERLFQRFVDPRLTCREMTCEAAGADACRFAFMLEEGEGPPLAT